MNIRPTYLVEAEARCRADYIGQPAAELRTELRSVELALDCLPTWAQTSNRADILHVQKSVLTDLLDRA